MPTIKLDKVIINGLAEETTAKPILVYNPVTKRVYWQTSPNARIAALEAKLDTNNNFKSIPDPGYTFNAGTRVLTMNANWVGTINGVDYTNLAAQPFPAIPLAASGYSRIDLIVFNTDAIFERIAGTESTFTPVAPAKPANTLEATFLTVGDGVVDVPVTPKPKSPVTSVNGMRGDVTIAKATDTAAGLVKTDTTVADPVVYVKETVDTLLEGKANYFLDIKTITGITYNVIIGDILHELVYAGTLPMNVIIPNNSTVAFPIGTIFYTLGTNTGIITASGAAGVTLSLKAGLSLSAIQNEVRQYTKIGTNTWSVRGDLNLGAVTQTELSYLQGATSNLQAQINAKTSLSGGVANRLMMWLTATTATVSRIWDTGTFLGIGTTKTPTKDLTFGNQSDRVIGIEQSDNNTAGRNLSISAGRNVNYVENTTIQYTNMQIAGVKGVASDPNGDVYIADVYGNMYKQTQSSGGFFVESYGTGGCDSHTFRIHSNGDMYIASGGVLRKRTGRTGNFVTVSTPISVKSLDITPNGDMYIIGTNTDMYKQTGLVGSFVACGYTIRNYQMIKASGNGNVYLIGPSNDVYVQVAGQSVLTNATFNSSPYSIASASNGDMYFNTYQQVYKLDGTTGVYSLFQGGFSNWFDGGSTVASNGNVYFVGYTSGIYMLNNSGTGASDLNGGTLKFSPGTGKGTGKSRLEIYTGQKTASGTDMQVETLREYIDENGYHIYTSIPVYANDAAADADTNLPSGASYKLTGNRTIFHKP